MRLALHPESRCDAVSAMTVEAAHKDGRLALRYVVSGTISALRLPAAAEPARTDELWRHTCFEAFLAAETGYYEFNFAPSTQWAVYRFEDYRLGMRPADGAPRLAVKTGARELELRAEIEIPPDAETRLGLAAVIEEANGRLSYWALTHASGKPDFHSIETWTGKI